MKRRQWVAATAVAGLLLAGTGCSGLIDEMKANYAVKQGNDLYKAQDYLKAIQWYRYAQYLNPELPLAYYHAGLAYLGEYKPGSKHPKDQRLAQGAIDNLKQYLRTNPGNEDARNYLLTVYIYTEQFPEAAQYFEQLLKQFSNDQEMTSKLIQTIGMIYAKAGDFESSLEWYKKRADIEKDDPEALYTIGVLCWDKVYKSPLTLALDRRIELIEMGMDYLQRAMEIRPNYFAAAAYINLLNREKAKVAAQTGNMEDYAKYTQEAERWVKVALEMRKAEQGGK